MSETESFEYRYLSAEAAKPPCRRKPNDPRPDDCNIDLFHRCRRRSGALDLDLDLRFDLGVQAQVRAVRAEALHRLLELKPLLVDLWAAGLRDRLGDLSGRHLTEQPAAIAGLRLDADLQRAELLSDLLRLLEVSNLADLARAADRVDLLERAFGRSQRDAT